MQLIESHPKTNNNQFHIDPPGEEESNPIATTMIITIGSLIGIATVMMSLFFWRKHNMMN